MKLHELKSIIDTFDMEEFGDEEVSVITFSLSGYRPSDIIVGIASDIALMITNSELEKKLQNYVGPDDFVILVPDNMHTSL